MFDNFFVALVFNVSKKVDGLKRQTSSFPRRLSNLGLALNLLGYHQFQKSADFADSTVAF